ncbi:MAG: chemotaxis protein CheW [Cyanobacteriota bacterium]|nr:chemotaxis protein CheW [Cyanobacteriota bacterium]
MDTINPQSNIEHCWNVIGVTGNRSCRELSTYIHCRNCPVHSTAGRNLLERSYEENYRREWTDLFAQNTIGDYLKSDNLAIKNTVTVMIFRLQQEWLAISAEVFQQTTPSNTVHTIPHRSNKILRGLVNIRGELHLCISLNNLLNLKVGDINNQSINPVVYSRMLLMEKAGKAWVFAVDEVYGIHRFDCGELRNSAKNMMQINETFSKGFFQWKDYSVSYLDDELLFKVLDKKVSP